MLTVFVSITKGNWTFVLILPVFKDSEEKLKILHKSSNFAEFGYMLVSLALIQSFME